ncbi:flagellar hook-length control protein [Rubripirellula amarantea]|uniref:Flagellar hook-length control protein n=1 Tax=Rubripirellula amarantea TaxID=2527999 RepID=A0A5C5WRA4_9BACT|nr:flagellar hook-length control protein FliK [Rubripirellula amarantea]TWT52990.1 flagellar hook-length control protein [Rubripirellula amarantea]
MSDSVGETTQVTKYANAIRKLRASSGRSTTGFDEGGFNPESAEMLGDAFAQVFAAMAATSAKPTTEADSVASDDPVVVTQEVSGDKRDSDEDDTEESAVLSNEDDSHSTEAVTLGTEAVSHDQNKSFEDEIAAKQDAQNDDDVAVADEASLIEEEEVESAMIAPVQQAAATVEQVDTPSTEKSKIGGKVIEAPVADNAQADSGIQQTKSSTSEATGPSLESTGVGEGAAGQPTDGQDQPQGESQNRRRYTRKDDNGLAEPSAGSSSNRVNAAVEGSAKGSTSSAQAPAASDALSAVEGQTQSPVVSPGVNVAAAASRTATVAGSGSQASAARAAGSGAVSRSIGGLEQATGLESSNAAPAAAGQKSTKAKDADTSKADMMNRIKLIQRVSKAFQHLGPDGGVVRLKLAPAELGTVRVEMRIDQKRVNARVVAETEAAAAALQEHLPDLRSRLEGYGMQVEKLEIETESFSGQTSNFDDQTQSDQADQRANRRDHSGSGSGRRNRNDSSSREPLIPVSQLPLATAASGGMDIHI